MIKNCRLGINASDDGKELYIQFIGENVLTVKEIKGYLQHLINNLERILNEADLAGGEGEDDGLH